METQGHITDFEAINDGYISITPVHLDMTSYSDIASLEKWL
jgi:5'-nucleotidase